jgi:hypothetical protein
MPSAAERQYLHQLRIASKTSRDAARLWRSIDRSDLSDSWSNGLAKRVLAVLAAGQFAAASLAQPYVEAAVAETGAASDVAGEVSPRAFAGIASDGRPLQSLLLLPLIEAKTRIVAGQSVDLALTGGLRLLVRVVETQVADAGRGAVSVSSAVDAQVAGHERVVSHGGCGRCIVLAGKFYRWSDGFLRHPKCHCGMRLVTRTQRRKGWTPETTPRALYDALSPADRAKSFSTDAQKAIADGADLADVVNVRGGMATAGGRRSVRTGRLTPEQIYRDAAGNRAAAVRLLAEHGYITT